jgi:hypothetical protein
VNACIKSLAVKDSRPPKRVFLSINEAGQCTAPFGAIQDDLRFTQLYTQGRVSAAADWQPVLLQRLNTGHLQLQLPPALLAAALVGTPLDLQIGGGARSGWMQRYSAGHVWLLVSGASNFVCLQLTFNLDTTH